MSFLRAMAAIAATTSVSVVALPARAQVTGIDLSSMGIAAPTLDVGTTTVEAGTLQYSNSGGAADAFSVGTSTSISASASASSTPDYDVNSTATFGIDASAINQVIGTSGSTNNTNSNSASSSIDIDQAASSSASTSVDRNFKQENGGWWRRRNNQWESRTEQEYTSERSSEYSREYDRAYERTNSALTGQGTISGSFAKASIDTADTAGGSNSGESSNDVTVKGIGADNTVTAAANSVFSSDITKGAGLSDGAGTASGSAAGNVSTTASANANSTQFVSSFVQAY
jgi:hypothetical protein